MVEHWIARALALAADLGLASLLANGFRGVDDLAAATGAHGPSLYRLLRALTCVDALVEGPARDFTLTPTGRDLLARPPAPPADVPGLSEEGYRAWAELGLSVRTGRAAFEQVVGMPFFAYLAQQPDAARGFDEVMAGATESAARALVEAYDFSRFGTIVDVGGGEGVLLATILERAPRVRGILFDTPRVGPAARRLLATRGVQKRCAIATGDFFKAVPSGGDAYLLSWIVHDWGDADSRRILRACRRAMTRSGRLLLLEQIVPGPNVKSFSKLYDLHLLVMTGGRERTEEEFRTLLASAGFRLTRMVPTASARILIEAAPAEARRADSP
jgi:hypothetical protein